MDDALLRERHQVPSPRSPGTGSQNSELEEEHNHHIGPSLLNDGIDRITEYPDIVDKASSKRDAESQMEEPGVRRGLLLEKFDTPVSNPAPDLARDQCREHDEEPSSNLFPEDGHGKAGLGDGEPCSLGELLDLDRTQRAETQLRQGIYKATVQ